MKFQTSFSFFGIFDDPKLKGFSTQWVSGKLEEVKKNSLDEIFQLHEEIELIEDFESLHKVSYVVSKKSELQFLLISTYIFTKIDTDNRICYNGYSMAIMVKDNELPNFFEISNNYSSFLADIRNEKYPTKREHEGDVIETEFIYRVYENSRRSDKAAICLVPPAKNLTSWLPILINDLFTRYLNRKSVYFTSNRSLFDNMGSVNLDKIDRFYESYYDPVNDQISQLEAIFKKRIEECNHTLMLCGEKLDALTKMVLDKEQLVMELSENKEKIIGAIQEKKKDLERLNNDLAQAQQSLKDNKLIIKKSIERLIDDIDKYISL